MGPEEFRMNGIIARTLAALRAHLADSLPSARSVEIFNGPLSERSIRQMITTHGSLHITFLEGKRNGSISGQTRLACSVAIFTVTSGYDRTIDGVDIMEAVGVALTDFHPAVEGRVRECRTGGFEAIYSAETERERTGVSLWGLSWGFEAILGAPGFSEEAIEDDPNDLIRISDGTVIFDETGLILDEPDPPSPVDLPEPEPEPVTLDGEAVALDGEPVLI